VLLNLSGGYREFLSLSRSLGLGSDVDQWVIGRPPAHPMTELASYFRAADCTAQASHAEGLGLSPLESLSCGVPVVATRVGGMAVTLDGFARLVPPRSPEGMADAFVWVASHYDEARAQAMRGRAMVQQQWSREKTFADLARVLDETRRHST
jgi:mannosyltransferase